MMRQERGPRAAVPLRRSQRIAAAAAALSNGSSCNTAAMAQPSKLQPIIQGNVYLLRGSPITSGIKLCGNVIFRLQGLHYQMDGQQAGNNQGDPLLTRMPWWPLHESIRDMQDAHRRDESQGDGGRGRCGLDGGWEAGAGRGLVMDAQGL